ncbi:hypothetical protein ACFIQG_21970, partial [Comamonas odontotermitis]
MTKFKMERFTMGKILRVLRCMLIGMFLIGGGQLAFAQKVLMLTTNVTGPNTENQEAIDLYNNMQAEFTAVVGASNLTRLSVLGDTNAISQATFSNAQGPYDIVIVSSVYRLIDSTNWAVLQNAVANRWANSIIFFVDACCGGANGSAMLTALNGATGSSFSLGTVQAGYATFPLNTNASLASSFTGLNPIHGGDLAYINNVPANNALYLATGTPSTSFPSAGSTAPVNDVYGLLIPADQSNAGRGACVFATVDASPFFDLLPGYPMWTNNRGKIGPAFVNAATSTSGSCGYPKVTKSFDVTDIYLGDNGSTLSIQLLNDTTSAISVTNLTDNLPAPLQIGAGVAASHTCTGGTLTATSGASNINFTGFSIPVGGCSVSVPVIWPITSAGLQACVSTPTVINTITPGVDFVTSVGQITTPATASLTCHAAQLTVSKSPLQNPIPRTSHSFAQGLISPHPPVCAIKLF